MIEQSYITDFFYLIQFKKSIIGTLAEKDLLISNLKFISDWLGSFISAYSPMSPEHGFQSELL